jgi:outer membrane protein assembly factor BamE (lipoprotein component of BamABCDE complex)
MRSSGIAAAIAASLLVGCAASGVQVSEQQAQSFQVGRSTYSDVLSQLGDPTTSTVDSKGTRIAVYSYAAVQSRPQNFIPYIGPLVSGYDTKSSAVTFTFDQRGVLTNTSSTQSNVGSGANLAAGSSQPAPNVDQPRVPR